MLDWGDPETFWLNVMNAALGAVCLVCLALFAGGVVREIVARARRRRETVVQVRDHMFAVPGLGLTMADGGEPLPDGEGTTAGGLPETTGGTPVEPAPVPAATAEGSDRERR
jgi:hypothetical protein